MKTLQTLGSAPLGILIAIAVWAILFAIILNVLKKSFPFEGWTAYIIAASAAMLSMIGISQFLAPLLDTSVSADQNRPFMFLLLPYAAMGISMLLILIIRFYKNIFPARIRKENDGNSSETSGDDDVCKHNNDRSIHHTPRKVGHRIQSSTQQGNLKKKN